MNYKILVSLIIFNMYHVNLPMEKSRIASNFYSHHSPQVINSHPIFTASYNGDIDLVQRLLNEGADPNSTNIAARTPLHFAANNQDPNIDNDNVALALLKHGANVNALNGNNETPLHIAALNGKSKLIDVLLSHGANPNGYDPKIETSSGNTPVYKNTPLHHAASRPYTHIIDALVNAGADVNARNKQEDTPLSHSLRFLNIHFDTVQKLLDLGADPNIKNNNGETALHLAVQTNNPTVLKILLAKRPDPFIKNNQGQTAADIALNENIKQMIQQYQASYKDRKNLRALTERLKEKRTKQGKTGDYGQLIKIASEYL